MKATKVLNTAKGEIQRTRIEIRRSWRPEERAQRRQTAAARQQWLFSVWFTQDATVPARVENNNVVVEPGICNLTEIQCPALVHHGADKT